MCHAREVTAIALAVILGLVAFPLVLVFGPAYFPWTVLALAALGGAMGLATAPRGLLRTLGLAVVLVTVAVGVRTLTSNRTVDRSFLANAAVLAQTLLWIGSLLGPVLVGAAAGAWLRSRWGLWRAAAAGGAGVLAIALFGAGLALALAPAEAANAPACADGFDCPRTWCAQMAERRRLLAVERVVAWDGRRITCTYTAWGGIAIGQADVGYPGGGGWTDGAWPRILSGR